MALGRQLEQKRLRLTAARERLTARSPERRQERLAAQLAAACTRMENAMHSALLRREHALRQAALRLTASGPSQTLRRGYAVLLKDGKAVRSAAALAPGDALQIVLADGRVNARAIDVEKGGSSDGGKEKDARL